MRQLRASGLARRQFARAAFHRVVGTIALPTVAARLQREGTAEGRGGQGKAAASASASVSASASASASAFASASASGSASGICQH